jgi:ABC-type uncharacterized transport system permease subunit
MNEVTSFITADSLALLIAATLNAGTVVALAALGLLLNERAGVLNLGAEGMMLVAAIAGFATGVATGNDWLAFGAGALAGAVMAGVFGLLVIWLNTNQYATGLALSLFGSGLSAFVGIRYTQERLPERPHFDIPWLSDLPFVGTSLVQAPSAGLHRGAAGAGHDLVPDAFAPRLGAARGGRIPRIGARPGLRGASHPPGGRDGRRRAVRPGRRLSFPWSYTPMWVEGMVAGKGWIALALTTFATWRPGRVLLGAYLFGGVTMLQFQMQGQGVAIPSQFLTMLPYVATIVVLVLISRNPTWIRLNMPASLGKPFHPGTKTASSPGMIIAVYKTVIGLGRCPTRFHTWR